MSWVVMVKEVGPFRLTRHAVERAIKRSIELDAVGLVLQHGRPIRDERGDRYSLEGVHRPQGVSPDLWRDAVDVVVAVNQYGWIPTVFRAHRAGAGKKRG